MTMAFTTRPTLTIRTFYVIYSTKHYGHNGVYNTVPSDPLSGSSETVPLRCGQIIASAQGYDLHDPAIVLFRQAGFIGNSQQYRSTQDDLTQAKYTFDVE